MPAGIWICRARSDPTEVTITREDRSDSEFVCTDVSTAEHVAKFGYYAWRILKDVIEKPRLP